MSCILCTFPGKFGDLLWALPTVRAIAETHGEPVDLAIAGAFGSIRDLIERQPYIGECAADPIWQVELGAPITPRIPPEIDRLVTERGYSHVYHLGYFGWPDRPLPSYTYAIAQAHTPLRLAPIDLGRPWITIPPSPKRSCAVYAGWSDEHFELKTGLTDLVKRATRTGYSRADLWHVGNPPGSRWAAEYHPSGQVKEPWIVAAQWIAGARAFLGCCSALHVLAVACGIPAVIMEPNPQRHHPIFWPLGMDGPQVRIVRGGDGQPTFDARHVADAIREALR